MIEITPKKITPNIGAVINGVNLERLEVGDFERLYDLLLSYKVLFFTNQYLDEVSHKRIASYFDSSHERGADQIDGVDKTQLIEAASDHRKHTWHTDRSWLRTPPAGALLYAIRVPECGGDTIWANTEKAYQGLPRHLKRECAKLKVVHDNSQDLERKGLNYPVVSHPLVRKHPDTGLPSLWLSFNVSMRVEGFPQEESDEFLRELYDFVITPEYQVRHRWSENDLVIWDNRCTIHYAIRDYQEFPRKMRRVLFDRRENPVLWME